VRLTARNLTMAGYRHNSFNEEITMIKNDFFNGWEENGPKLSNWEQFCKGKPHLGQYLLDVCGWNDFAKSLLQGIEKYGTLTEKQLAALVRMHDKHLARQKEQAKPAPKFDLTKIALLFKTARENLIKRPKFRVGDLVLMPSKKDERIFVKDGPRYEDIYFGAVSADGSFRQASGCPEWVLESLKTLAENPLGEAQAYGQRTGECSCCGRELTNEVSIELGIGPICREKWGL